MLDPRQAPADRMRCGSYQASTGQTSCDTADAGHYVEAAGQISQTACSAGTYQPSTGQTSCDDADAGHYVGTR